VEVAVLLQKSLRGGGIGWRDFGMCDVLKAEVQYLVLRLAGPRYCLLPSITPLRLPLSSVVPDYGIPLLTGRPDWHSGDIRVISCSSGRARQDIRGYNGTITLRRLSHARGRKGPHL